ncbi:hypothetical protein AMES_5717 [Amycolatopsis mediterranei S699]|uniref:Uncharacterized protein n=2 Tax=Amycolatopsis mediterranei TaxID=33910 RepID=A0A0H3DB86_AMYMU|nr:hypothetical protein [Amycolatopsis mediterranei]ADJ47542.1 hypothetical protein AMED_5795 [Amycolatopsis mediterranei U32]AEK44407.1 hypothetical protein RAM_29660 [Amycolatopsis mediterranei S699]AFO79253.1 hypothetical protein AMES_5717 [Amycolatopsis mediterranei S699]AGT86381.1 hypothetical protein B737_5717 [Amycolatopsis mediterranei RB]KDO12830.1 hypothetical protein DV26_00115 [Amycolatopsis mediterranei]
MTADDELAKARHAYKVATERLNTAKARLKKAGRKALDELEQKFGKQVDVAAALHYSTSNVAKLRPNERDTPWEPRGLKFYKTVDKETGNRHDLGRLRTEFDQAKRAVSMAADAVHDAEATADIGSLDLESAAVTTATAVSIDDVQVFQKFRCVVLDVRVRNTGPSVANLTRVSLRILDRKSYLTAYAPSAGYDLLVDGDEGEVGVRHSLLPDEVDNFLVTLGFTEAESGYEFTAELGVRYNGDQVAVYRPLVFESCFD